MLEIKKLEDELKLHRWWFDYPEFYKSISEIKEFTRFIELGTWKGYSITFLANLLRDRKGLELYGVDLFEKSNYAQLYGKRKNGRITQVELNSVYEVFVYNLVKTDTRHLIKDIKGCSWEVADQFEDEYFDFIFIDAGHIYEDVSRDIKAWFPKIKKTGIFAGHDWETEGVRRAVTEYFKDKSYSIIRSSLDPKLNSVWCLDFRQINKNEVRK